MTGASESTTGHRWPCTGFYVTSMTDDRTTRCTCGVGRPRRRTIPEIVRALEDAQDMDAIRELIPELRASTAGRYCPTSTFLPGDGVRVATSADADPEASAVTGSVTRFADKDGYITVDRGTPLGVMLVAVERLTRVRR